MNGDQKAAVGPPAALFVSLAMWAGIVAALRWAVGR